MKKVAILIGIILFFSKSAFANEVDLNVVALQDVLPEEELNISEIKEKTKVDTWKEEIHEALFGEVTEISTTPILDKYLNKDFEHGPFSNLNINNMFRGYVQNVWNDGEYKNTLYTNDSLTTTIEGKFRNPKFAFRSMFFWTPSKPEHGFFNDVWGDQFITYNYTNNDGILLGYARYDNGIEGCMGPHMLPFFFRSQLSANLGNERNLAVKAFGEHKYFNYGVSFGSSGRNFYDWFPGEEFVAKFDIKPLAKLDKKYGNLLIGATYDGGNADGGHVYNVGNTYLDYEYKRLKLTFEYGTAKGSNGSTGFSPNRSEGLNATAAYRISQKLQALFRYDWFDYNKEKDNDERTEYTVGINYFIKGQALKIMLNYTMYSQSNGQYGSKIYAGTQIIL